MDQQLSISDRALFEINRFRREAVHLDRKFLYPWWRRCTVKTLIVTDGVLDFGHGDFGLSAFIKILQIDNPFYAHFQLTLAHLRADTGGSRPDMLESESGIANRIRGFRFDDPAHFVPGMYDQIWLFGIETSFHQTVYGQRNTNAYPADRLGDTELANVAAHMNGGGGMFATGDHGALGRGLCGSIIRVRNMRHWNSFLNTSGQDEVSMSGPRRNDTNHVGNDLGTQFSDQSDDIPQPLDLKLYSTPLGVLKNARYPHPVFCGRTGRITVFPDHPHEGECKEPEDTSLTYPYDGSREYPDAADGSGQIVPEIIAWSHVPAGNTARASFVGGGSKQSTIAHNFGAVSAYDGHLADRGRVICDATWHHFINVNLIGVVEGGGFDQFGDTDHVESPTKNDGFLSTPQGRIALAKIKNYFTNIGVWISPRDKIACFHRRFWWDVIYHDRIMEAALVDPNVGFDRITIDTFYSIGVHARDVLGRRASQCQTTEWVFDWIREVWPEVQIWVNPWDPIQRFGKLDLPMLPVFDPMPMVDVALGAAIVAMRQAFPFPPDEIDEKFESKAREAANAGARKALEVAAKQTNAMMRQFTQMMRAANE